MVKTERNGSEDSERRMPAAVWSGESAAAIRCWGSRSVIRKAWKMAAV